MGRSRQVDRCVRTLVEGIERSERLAEVVNHDFPSTSVEQFPTGVHTALREGIEFRAFGADSGLVRKPPLLLGLAGIMDHVANCLELGVDPKQEPRDRAEGDDHQ